MQAKIRISLLVCFLLFIGFTIWSNTFSYENQSIKPEIVKSQSKDHNQVDSDSNAVFTVHVFLDISIGGQKPNRVVIGLSGHQVPKTAKNFELLATGEKGYGLKNSIFHRVIAGFMIQGGDFERGDGTGGYSALSPQQFPDENFILKHDSEGVISMANSGRDTNGSQFFITLAPQPHLDGKHVVFGKVIRGMEHIRAISQVATNPQDRPKEEVKIIDSGIIHI